MTPTGDPRASIHTPRVGIVEQDPKLTSSGITRGGADASREDLGVPGSNQGLRRPEGRSALGSPERQCQGSAACVTLDQRARPNEHVAGTNSGNWIHTLRHPRTREALEVFEVSEVE